MKDNITGDIRFVGAGFITFVTFLLVCISKENARNGAWREFVWAVRVKPGVTSTAKDFHMHIGWLKFVKKLIW